MRCLFIIVGNAQIVMLLFFWLKCNDKVIYMLYLCIFIRRDWLTRHFAIFPEGLIVIHTPIVIEFKNNRTNENICGEKPHTKQMLVQLVVCLDKRWHAHQVFLIIVLIYKFYLVFQAGEGRESHRRHGRRENPRFGRPGSLRNGHPCREALPVHRPRGDQASSVLAGAAGRRNEQPGISGGSAVHRTETEKSHGTNVRWVRRWVHAGRRPQVRTERVDPGMHSLLLSLAFVREILNDIAILMAKSLSLRDKEKYSTWQIRADAGRIFSIENHCCVQIEMFIELG